MNFRKFSQKIALKSASKQNIIAQKYQILISPASGCSAPEPYPNNYNLDSKLDFDKWSRNCADILKFQFWNVRAGRIIAHILQSSFRELELKFLNQIVF